MAGHSSHNINETNTRTALLPPPKYPSECFKLKLRMRELRVSKVRHDACFFSLFLKFQILGGNSKKLHDSNKKIMLGGSKFKKN